MLVSECPHEPAFWEGDAGRETVERSLRQISGYGTI